MKKLTTYLTLLLACFLVACQNDDTVNFSYSPTTPRAGESVVFSNLTKEGEDWKWTFGDGGESTIQSPTKVYQEAGTYTITLKVDDKKYRTCTKTITVRDTMPTIVCSTDTLQYYQTATFKVDFYNPNKESVTYAWSLPESATITSGDQTSATLSAYFTEKDTDITISLLLTIGTTTHSLTKTYHVIDAAATALLCATTDGELLRQRLYPNGAEAPSALPISIAQTKALLLHKDDLYLLANGIYAFNLNTHTTQTINSEAHASAGCIDNSTYTLYWVDNQSIHDLHVVVHTDKVFATTSQLTAFPHTAITAIAQYASLYLVAGDKGIYRFSESDINSGIAPTTPTILNNYNITHMAVDAIARKIYFIANNALYISNIDGSYPVQLSPSATTLTIDNMSNRLYFATTEGIAYLPLIQSPNNATTAQASFINQLTNITAIIVDFTSR